MGCARLHHLGEVRPHRVQPDPQHSYRLLDQEKVILEIEKAAGVSPVGDIVTERVARDLKPVLEEVTSEIDEGVTDELDARERLGVVRDVVEKRRPARQGRPSFSMRSRPAR